MDKRERNSESSGLISRAELARRWRLSVMTLKRREAEGVLRPLKLGRAVRYRLDEVLRIEAGAEVAR